MRRDPAYLAALYALILRAERPEWTTEELTSEVRRRYPDVLPENEQEAA